jgi:hypothetical protein
MLGVSYNKRKLDSHLVTTHNPLGLHELGVILNEPTHFYKGKFVVKF